MQEKDKDTLIITAALNRFNEFRLPRAKSLKEKVDSGEALSDYDLKFLERALNDARELDPIIERNSKFSELRDKAVTLLQQILEKDAENQAK